MEVILKGREESDGSQEKRVRGRGRGRGRPRGSTPGRGEVPLLWILISFLLHKLMSLFKTNIN